MTKVAKVCIVLAVMAAITAILHLTGVLSSREPTWVYWLFLIASAAALVWLIAKLRA
jgi:hypothetical protein